MSALVNFGAEIARITAEWRAAQLSKPKTKRGRDLSEGDVVRQDADAPWDRVEQGIPAGDPRSQLRPVYLYAMSSGLVRWFWGDAEYEVRP